MYVEKNELYKTPCTELIDCFTAKDAQHSTYDLPGIGVKVTPELARMYRDRTDWGRSRGLEAGIVGEV